MATDARTLRVAQAQGMVAVQANLSLDEALGRLAAEAESSDRTIDEIAALVIDGVVRFDG